ncbi:MAG: DUF2079 domain-containing protein [Candidatus Thermoplasmatota archaeon]|nr:DUF2079 domain-containing protein [Candidatus Thermoplasmatota archaeon]
MKANVAFKTPITFFIARIKLRQRRILSNWHSGFKNLTTDLLLCAFALYVIAWGYIGIAKYFSLSSSVYDLGVSMQTAYMIMYSNWTFATLIKFLIVRNGIALFFAPVAIMKNYPLLISIQAIFVAASVFPLYGVCKRLGFTKLEGALLSISYLLFFPLDGVVWFDFHYQSFFPFLFIFGYYLYLRGHWKSSLFSFLLSGFTRYPFMIFPLLFSLTLLLEIVGKKLIIGKKIRGSALYFSISLLSFSLVILTVGYILIGGFSAIPLHTSASSSVSLDLDIKLLTLFLLFAPLLFIPVLSYRWMLLSTPFIYLLLTSNSGAYVFPSLFHRQYSSGIVPFLYLGLIDGLRVISSRKESKRIFPQKFNFGYERLRRFIAKLLPKGFIITAILVILIASSFYYQPFGPFNNTTTDNFHLESETNINMSIFHSLEYIISLIPPNESHVLIQNNIVEALPGPIGNTLLVPQYDVGPNVTMSDIRNNSFPTLEGSVIGTTPIDFAIADANNQHTLLQPGNEYFPSMIELSQMLLASGYYEIRAEVNNILLIQRNYQGPISFSPFHSVYKANEFHSTVGKYSEGVLVVNQAKPGKLMWSGPYTSPFANYLSLVPGAYKAIFALSATNVSSKNQLQLVVSADGGVIILNTSNVSGRNLAKINTWHFASVTFYVSNLVSGIDFEAFSNGWNGTVCLRDMELYQLGTANATSLGMITGLIGVTPPSGTKINATSSLPGYPPQNAIDGNVYTAWISSQYSATLLLTFPSSVTINGIGLLIGSVPSGSINILINLLYLNNSVTVYNGTQFIASGPNGAVALNILFGIHLKTIGVRLDFVSKVSLIRINELTLIEQSSISN